MRAPGGRKPWSANDVLRSRFSVALLCLAATATTQHQLLELLFDAGDAGQQAFDEEAADASYLHNGAMPMAQMGLLLVASEPFSRKGVTYAVGPSATHLSASSGNLATQLPARRSSGSSCQI